MTTAAPSLFKTTPKDHLGFGLYKDRPNYSDVVHFLEFEKRDVSQATGVPIHSVRYDDKIKSELADRIKEWAILLNLVAEFFQGDGRKTALWFSVSNPLLGNIKPRDMIRFGRFKKLYTFIWNALEENKR